MATQPMKATLTAVIALMRKDLVLYFSNRRSLLMTIVAPIAIAAFFGYLFDSGGRPASRIALAVTDLDQSALSKQIVAALAADPMLDVRPLAEQDAIEQVRRGTLRAAAVLPQGFGSRAPGAMFGALAKPELALHFDPSQPMVLQVVKGLLAQHISQAVARVAFGGGGGADDASGGTADNGATVVAMAEMRRGAQATAQGTANPAAPNAPAPGLRFEMPFATREVAATSKQAPRYNSFAHAFAGMGVQFILFMGIELGVGVLLARRMGLWKRLQAAPLSRATLLGSRIASGAITSWILTAILYAVAIAFFGVRIDGSLAGFLAVAGAFGLLTASFGLLIAALGKTPEATRGLAVFVTLLLVMLGGAWVPSFMFPQWLQQLSLITPTRWAIDGLDAMTWRGLDFAAALPAVGAMLAFSALFGLIAIWRFRWEE